MSLGPLYVLLGEGSVQVLCPFFNWVVCLPGLEPLEFFIYFGDLPMSEVSFANIFSYMVGPLFILLMFSLTMQKPLILMKSHLCIIFFMSLALGDILVKILLHGKKLLHGIAAK